MVDFENDEARNNAATPIHEKVGGAVEKRIKKILPKVMVCNAYEE